MWPGLAWLELIWSDPTWQDLTPPNLFRADLTWPDLTCSAICLKMPSNNMTWPVGVWEGLFGHRAFAPHSLRCRVVVWRGCSPPVVPREATWGGASPRGSRHSPDAVFVRLFGKNRNSIELSEDCFSLGAECCHKKLIAILLFCCCYQNYIILRNSKSSATLLKLNFW